MTSKWQHQHRLTNEHPVTRTRKVDDFTRVCVDCGENVVPMTPPLPATPLSAEEEAIVRREFPRWGVTDYENTAFQRLLVTLDAERIAATARVEGLPPVEDIRVQKYTERGNLNGYRRLTEREARAYRAALAEAKENA